MTPVTNPRREKSAFFGRFSSTRLLCRLRQSSPRRPSLTPATEIPTFDEFLDLLEPHENLLLNLELKDYPDVEGDICYSTADKVIAEIERRGMADRIMLNCFSWKVLKYIADRYGSRYPLHGFWPEFLMQQPEVDLYPYLTYVCLFNCVPKDGKADWSPRKERELCFPEEFARVKAMGCEPCVCFVKDTPELMKAAIDRGVTMFTCNNPEQADKILRELGYR